MDCQTLLRIASDRLSTALELLAVVKAKKSAIIAGDIARLAELVERADALSVELRRDQLHSQAEADAPDVTVDELIKQMDPAQKKQFADIKARLLAVLDETLTANSINAALLSDALDYVDNTVRLIAAAQGSSSVYGRLGTLDQLAAASARAVDETA